MILYDFEGMFEKKLSDYMAKNRDKYSGEEWEEIVPKLYERFGDTVVKQIGKTPNQYYGEMSDGELIKTLCALLNKGIAVPEYLCRAIEGRNCAKLLLPLLYGTEEQTLYAMKLLAADGQALGRYMELITDESTPEEIKNACAEYLKEKADEVKEEALLNYKKGAAKEYMTEILSRCVIKDDRIFRILTDEFRSNDEHTALYAGYLAAYGDERALVYLLNRINDEDINYVEFRELKYAIECLGGEYAGERDFSSDPAYGLIKNHDAGAQDIFGNIKP